MEGRQARDAGQGTDWTPESLLLESKLVCVWIQIFLPIETPGRLRAATCRLVTLRPPAPVEVPTRGPELLASGTRRASASSLRRRRPFFGCDPGHWPIRFSRTHATREAELSQTAAAQTSPRAEGLLGRRVARCQQRGNPGGPVVYAKGGGVPSKTLTRATRNGHVPVLSPP